MTDLDAAGLVRQRWCEVLETDDVSQEDNFFLRGGHSVLAVRLTSALRDDLRIRIPVSVLFEASTLGEYVKRVETLVADA